MEVRYRSTCRGCYPKTYGALAVAPEIAMRLVIQKVQTVMNYAMRRRYPKSSFRRFLGETAGMREEAAGSMRQANAWTANRRSA